MHRCSLERRICRRRGFALPPRRRDARTDGRKAAAWVVVFSHEVRELRLRLRSADAGYDAWGGSCNMATTTSISLDPTRGLRSGKGRSGGSAIPASCGGGVSRPFHRQQQQHRLHHHHHHHLVSDRLALTGSPGRAFRRAWPGRPGTMAFAHRRAEGVGPCRGVR